jgi:hypothetical protein
VEIGTTFLSGCKWRFSPENGISYSIGHHSPLPPHREREAILLIAPKKYYFFDATKGRILFYAHYMIILLQNFLGEEKGRKTLTRTGLFLAGRRDVFLEKEGKFFWEKRRNSSLTKKEKRGVRSRFSPSTMSFSTQKLIRSSGQKSA